MEKLAEEIMKLINSKPYSPRKEEIMGLLDSTKLFWLNSVETNSPPTCGRQIIIYCKDGCVYAGYYGLAVDGDGDSIVDQRDADTDFPWVVLDPGGNCTAISSDEIQHWTNFPECP